MNISKLNIAWKFITGGREAVVDYVVGVLNDFIGREDIASKVREGYELSMKVLGYLQKYASWCPKKWEREYSVLIATTSTLTGVFSDGKITSAEIAACTEQFKKAYEEWMKED